MSTSSAVRRTHVMTAESFHPATYRRLVPAPGAEAPAPGTRIVAGTLVDASDREAVQVTGSMR